MMGQESGALVHRFAAVATALVCFLFLLMAENVHSYSHSVEGSWKDIVVGKENDGHYSEAQYNNYVDQYLMVFGNNSWVAPNSTISFPYNVSNSCALMKDKGIDNIFFYGDSYMRHIYAAFALTLSGNYLNGSISSGEYAMEHGAANCQYHAQFWENKCGIRTLDEEVEVCDGQLKLHHMHHGSYQINGCRERQNHPGNAINLFSVGNHKLGGGRHGIHDAPAHIELFQGFCGQLKKEKEEEKDVSNGCSNWWVSTHNRIIGWFDDEKPEYVEKFNVEMRSFFDSGACGDYNYIDVWNMTKSLINTFDLNAHSEQNKANSMTVSYDYWHYGMQINLAKTQIMLNAFENGLPSMKKKDRLRKRNKGSRD